VTGADLNSDLVQARIRPRMRTAFEEVGARARELCVTLGEAALVVGVERVAEADEARGLFP
jgi:glutamate dehydrogenase (NAD(P)+)